VKVEQASDKFCNSIEVCKFMGKTEYFYDEEGVIPEAKERRTPVVSSQDIGKGSDRIKSRYNLRGTSRPKEDFGNFMHTLLLAQNEAGRRKLCQGM
jgi:hypothetical protein